jgi:hypothetical protein
MNRLEHRPPQLSGAKKNAQEAQSNLYELTFPLWGPMLILDVK